MKSYLKTKVLIGTTGLLTGLLAPALAFAQSVSADFCWDPFGDSCATTTYGGIAYIGYIILNTINYVLVPVLFAVAFVVFLYGVATTYIFSRGNEDEIKRGHSLILWGIIGFVVMVSVWGLVNVLSETFGLDGETIRRLPTSPLSS